ncbi:hypothetical protein SBP28_003419 [Candidozyma auris]
MVSFSCEVCNDTIVKKKLDQHRCRCPDAYFTCIDCSTTFNGTEYRSHTQCISEAEKYEKGLYKGKKQNPKPVEKKQESRPDTSKPDAKPVKTSKEKSKKSKDKSESLDLKKYANGSLYKVVKAISSETKNGKKDVLKKLQVKVEDGKIVLSM